MRIVLASSVALGVLLSCARDNPAYGVSAGGDADAASGHSGSGSGTHGGTDATSLTTSAATGPTLTTADTSGMPSDAGIDALCWSTRLTVDASFVGRGGALDDVPVLVRTSKLGPDEGQDDLRFYQGDLLLAHELEADGSIAWVRLPTLPGDEDTQFRAVNGASCDPPQALPPEQVWSANYVAVFHFDDGSGSPPIFVDSVRGIELVADPDTDVSPSPGMVGAYASKSGNDPLIASDSALNLSGPTPLSTLAWVRLDPQAAGVLPWSGDNARHREVLAKLPGYRLNVVRGEVTRNSALQPRPFFNISEVIPSIMQDNAFGDEAVSADQWTLLAGTYDTVSVRLFVDGTVAATTQSTLAPGANDEGVLRIGRWLHGGLDEIRISAEARTAEWIAVQYASMTDALIVYGRPEAVSP